MKWTVVGYWGGYPGVGEATTGYLLQQDGWNLLIDCGSGVLSQLQRYLHPNEIHAVVLSHYHFDHVADIGPLKYARLVQNQLTEGLASLPIYGHTLDAEGFSSLSYKNYTEGRAYTIEKPLMIGPFRFEFLTTQHPVPCAGMRITNGEQTITFTADTSYFPALADFASGSDLLVAECNFYKNQDAAPAGHMNSIDAGTLAEKAGVGQLLLTHLPHFGNHLNLVNEAASVCTCPVELAYSGWTWET